ncbi:MAG: FAD-dependent monooxygenase, partial [Pseudomonadota bacterium]
MKIIIAGGGIGGLTTALCCLHHGHDVVVLERAAELGDVGAGIQIPPNAMRVFEALGLGGAFDRFAVRPEAIEARMGRSGQMLFNIPLAETALERWGSPYLHIHRADYITLLASALREKEKTSVRLGQEVAGYRQTLNGVTVELADGSELSGDVLIGADGVHSVVRDQMLGADRPVFTGNVAWRAIVPIKLLGADAPRPTACAWMGRGAHCATYRVRRGEFANLV